MLQLSVTHWWTSLVLCSSIHCSSIVGDGSWSFLAVWGFRNSTNNFKLFLFCKVFTMEYVKELFFSSSESSPSAMHLHDWKDRSSVRDRTNNLDRRKNKRSWLTFYKKVLLWPTNIWETSKVVYRRWYLYHQG